MLGIHPSDQPESHPAGAPPLCSVGPPRPCGVEQREGVGTATMVTWYSGMLADVDNLLMLVHQIGAHDDRNRPYRDVARELRADEFIPVQKAVADLANRVHSARETPSVDEGIVYETMGLLVDLIPYMRYACRTGAYREGGYGSLVQRIDKVMGSMMMTVRSRMGFTDESSERPW